jgi:hypothetical protein
MKVEVPIDAGWGGRRRISGRSRVHSERDDGREEGLVRFGHCGLIVHQG